MNPSKNGNHDGEERLAFVFGAGSSRGALQAGALEVLLKADIIPDFVVGSSIGALNAAWLARYPTLNDVYKLQDLYRQTEFQEIFNGGVPAAVMNLLSRQRGLFDNSGMRALVSDHYAGVKIDDLALPCYLVATRVDDGALHVFGDDPEDEVLPAMLSSAAILPLFPPVTVNGVEYADGGLKSSLPLQTAVDRGATAIVAFNILTQLQPAEERETPYAMLLHSVDLVLHSQVTLAIAHCRETNGIPVYILDLESERYLSMLDLDGLSEVISEGREQAEAALDEIRDTIPTQAIRS